MPVPGELGRSVKQLEVPKEGSFKVQSHNSSQQKGCYLPSGDQSRRISVPGWGVGDPSLCFAIVIPCETHDLAVFPIHIFSACVLELGMPRWDLRLLVLRNAAV